MPPTETPPFVKEWIDTLAPATIGDLVPDPKRAAFFSADLINGFVHFGPLASPRVLGIVGTYTIKAELQGFSAAVAENINVTVNARLRVDLKWPNDLLIGAPIAAAHRVFEMDIFVVALAFDDVGETRLHAALGRD